MSGLQRLQLGTAPNDGTGEKAFTAFAKIDSMMQEMYGSSAIGGALNKKPIYLVNTRKALQRVFQGTGVAKGAFVGDSTMAAFGGASGQNGLTGARAVSPPAQLAALLTARGIPAQADSFFGNQAVAQSSVSLYDPRITLNGWTTGGTVSLGGACFQNTSTTSTALTFHPTENADSIDIYYIAAPGGGSFTFNIDNGASLGTTATAGTGTIQKVTYTGLGGGSGHYFNILPVVNSGNLFIVGMDTYLSTAKKLSLWQMGWIGSNTANWVQVQTGANYFPLAALPLMGQDFTVIDLGINDWLQAVALGTTQANLQTFISALKAPGTMDVILCCPLQSDPGTTGIPQATQDAVRNMIQQLAYSNNCACIDYVNRFGNQAAIAAAGLSYDNVHVNAQGYFDKAVALANFFSTI